MKKSNMLGSNRLLLHERRLGKSGYKFIAGVDEAGRGPLAGPVVACAVILPKKAFKAKIDDSKKLSQKNREIAFKEILKRSVVGIGVVNEKCIDRINIYQATKQALELAISDLKIKPDYVLVDGNMKPQAACHVKSIVGGDSKSLSIAAASIIAKVTRDGMMRSYDRVYPKYGFARHKGYCTRAHEKALKQHGPCPIHRFTFEPVAKLY
jgi:ribonuclease HII